MTNEELKKKIVEILNDVTTEPMIYKGRYLGDTQMPELKINAIADALIAAGIGDVKKEKFEADHYWNMWQGALVELERAEHRAEVAERALQIADELGELCGRKEDYVKQAEKELAEEGKNERRNVNV